MQSSPLDRSPSLSSNSSNSNSTTASSTLDTPPFLQPLSTFPNAPPRSILGNGNENKPSLSALPPSLVPGGIAGLGTRGSIGNLASLSSRSNSHSHSSHSNLNPVVAGGGGKPWVGPGHRTGATGGMSLDTTFNSAGMGKKGGSPLSHSNRSGNGVGGGGGEDRIDTWRFSSTGTHPLPQPPNGGRISPNRLLNQSPSNSPTRSTTPSQSHHHPHPNSSPTTQLPQQASPQRTNSIFSTRGGGGGRESPTGFGVGGAAGGGQGTLFSRSHRRANTLPHLGKEGLPIPIPETVVGAEEVVGLPGRVRLSAQTSSPFSPSAVFQSSHGLSTLSPAPPSSPGTATSPSSSPFPLPLPSQRAKGLDQQRRDIVAYEYLCHVAEAKEWMLSHIKRKASDEPIWPPSIGVKEFEQSLRTGYALAHLARSLGQTTATKGPIFTAETLQYKHIGNIEIFFKLCKEVEMEDNLRFETTDLYNGKNMPRVIYCLHVLARILERLGRTGGMRDLVGTLEFTDDEFKDTQKGLNAPGVKMPNFKALNKTPIKEDPEAEERARREEQEREERERWEREEAERVERERIERARAEEEARHRHFTDVVLPRFQARARGALVRNDYAIKLNFLDSHVPLFVELQAQARGHLTRQRLLRKVHQLQSAEDFYERLQAQIRGNLVRAAYQAKLKALRRVDVVRGVGGLQSAMRAALVRKRVDVQRQALGFVEPDVVGIQAQARGYLVRSWFLSLSEWHHSSEVEDEVVRLQALWRGVLARNKFVRVQEHLRANLNKVVKLQAAIRSRKQGSQYRQLRMGTNVPVNTIRNFVRLLDDSEFDYREELQVEALRKELVRSIRETQTLEDDVKELDTKIALLVRNKITHEVARIQSRHHHSNSLAPNKRNSLLQAANDPFATSSGTLDRQTQRKLELYQQLFWHLQTSPVYFATLFANLGRTGMTDKVRKSVEDMTFVVFGFAQNQREEFLMLKLFQASIHEELSANHSLRDFGTSNFVFVRLLLRYGRGVSHKQFLRNMLLPNVSKVVDDQSLDLNCNPRLIYQASLAAEETRTGVQSSRPFDVTGEQAITDPAVRKTFILHLRSLRSTTEEFLQAMYASTRSMPFGIRYAAREVFRALRNKFPEDSEANVLRVVGNLIFYRFIQPAIVAPETFDIVQSQIPPQQRKNLAEICHMLTQISAGLLFDGEMEHMMALNPFIEQSSASFTAWIYDVINVKDVEDVFHADEYIDAKAARSPVIWISPNDIYLTHSILAEQLDIIAPDHDDPLRNIVVELGGVPMTASADLSRARADEVPLTLTTRIRAQDDPEAGKKALFNQAKRRVLAILKIHHGVDLEAVLTQVVTEEDEDAWLRVVEEEEAEEYRQAQAQGRPVMQVSNDIRKMTFHDLKQMTLFDIVELRRAGLTDRADKYQSILNAIASDIRSKHIRRVQRQSELATMHGTLISLREKKKYLDDQKASYDTYIRESMNSIQKTKKKRLVLPWSLQASHERDLGRTGKRYKFGSYKYTAQTLYDRGVLLSIDQCSPRQFDKISLTISSDEVGNFEVTAASLGVTMTTVELKLEDLLEAQFVGKQTVSIGGVAKANLNLLVHLINRKFYA